MVAESSARSDDGKGRQPPSTDIEKIMCANRGEYDVDIALFMARLAAWSYADRADFDKALQTLQLADLETKVRGANQFELFATPISACNPAMFIVSSAYLLKSKSGRVAVLTYRGTEPANLLNWLTDATIHLEDFTPAGDPAANPFIGQLEAYRPQAAAKPAVPVRPQVHGGFYRNVLTTWPQVVTQLKSALAGPQKLEALYIAGHSLGGAMAVIAAGLIMCLKEADDLSRLLRGVYTFGQPLIGNADLAAVLEQRFGGRLFRHVYDHDIVPQLPPRSTGKAVHFGHEYRAARDCGYVLTRAPANAVTQVASACVSLPLGALAWVCQQFPVTKSYSFPYSWDDHSPIHYLRAFYADREKVTILDAIDRFA